MTLFIPDFSSWDAGVNMSGALAVIVKATQGPGYVNPYYAAMKAEAKKRGAFFAAYHFLEEGSAAAQADHAHAVIGDDVPALIDFEPMDPPQGASYPSLADCCGFTDRYRERGGTVNGCYLPEWYWARGANGLRGASLKPLAERGLWLWSSSYSGYTDAASGPGWKSYGGIDPPLIWQYTSSLRFGGIPSVDFSAFRGSKYAGKQDAASVAATLAELRSLMLTGKYPPAPAPPPAPLPDGDVRVPVVLGMTAGRADLVIRQAHLQPSSPGVPAAAIVTGTAPHGAAPLGAKVTVHAAPPPELLVNASGSWVQIMQTDLNRGGEHLAADGKFGAVTLAALIRFQNARRLSPDGIAGKDTWASLGNL